MKKKVKYILIAIGVALIVFGALIPTIFKSGTKTDKFTYDRDGALSNYTLTINVISQEEYEIDSATITLQDAFDRYNTLDKTISSPSVTKKKDGNDFVYTFIINLTQDEFFDYTKVESVSLTTNIGDRTAEEETISFGINWRIPVMIVVIFVGAGLTIAGISMIVAAKSYKKYAEQTRKELAQTNPEINTANMTDEEVVAKKRELRLENMQENNSGLASLFGIETKPKEKVCEYCGAVNGADSTKCSSCGANLKSKR